MRSLPDDPDLGAALRDGLRALPVPDTTPDFDARVLDALRAPVPWWRRLWGPARPLLLGASCSLSVTLVLLHWTLTAPAPQAPILGGQEKAGEEQSYSLRHPQNWGRGGPSAPPLDRLLDRMDLRAGSLAAAWAVPPSNPPDRRPEPARHAQAGRRAALIV